ncbi:2-isopropylmalate synthase [Spirochaeta africana]|uniref:2-isopropylmalate synthase n=1 Tax=Spirochaeta africana (strain ATCC 700263 / DSM 8902 / Z-7692) TaxID=889378 RepID=H9ULN5_SPIAZ|nr:2-isopropylmalate synthase [Spirochaeta africana]AFG38428.1 2-isopropylmalate synthase [Spirochaeta africana DSM 8902]
MPKYTRFPKVDLPDRRWPDNEIIAPPIWCSVDLRDGNQALANPMGVAQKLRYFQLLVDLGFKEIEVGFPAASEIEFEFVRTLIDRQLIPDDVSIQVLTQAREHLIKRTFESFRGARNVILHLYNSTSTLQRKITFDMSREEIKGIAVRGAQIVRDQIATVPETTVRLQYSPESFSDTELDFAKEVCDAVAEVWQPTVQNPVIFNLPATVEWATPNVHADQIEWMSRNLNNREAIILSVHTHNDRGTGVAATELALMAGAQRVEGTLFGNGERTGNLDIVTVALNMFSQGIDPGLDFSDIPSVRAQYEDLTGMEVHPRHPYGGDLVFTAFSGSHQDAIKKGMDRRADIQDPTAAWEVPYLLIDPRDIGRTYEAIIRINSQSGKGGVAYVMSREFGFDLPKTMHPEFGRMVNQATDRLGREATKQEIFDIFKQSYLELTVPLELIRLRSLTDEMGDHTITCTVKVAYDGQIIEITGRGNGPIDAFVHAMSERGWNGFSIIDFKEQAVGSGAGTEAAAYVQIQARDGGRFWGVGVDTDISIAGLKGVVSAYNRSRLA